MRFPSTNMSRPLQGLRRPVSQTSLGALQGTITVGIQVAGKFGYPTANIWWKYFQTSELFFNVSHNVCRARLAALVLLEVDFTSPSNKGPLPISFVEHVGRAVFLRNSRWSLSSGWESKEAVVKPRVK